MINTIGMIGTGNMGSAILRGIVEADYVKAGHIVAYDTPLSAIVTLVPGGGARVEGLAGGFWRKRTAQ